MVFRMHERLLVGNLIGTLARRIIAIALRIVRCLTRLLSIRLLSGITRLRIGLLRLAGRLLRRRTLLPIGSAIEDRRRRLGRLRRGHEIGDGRSNIGGIDRFAVVIDDLLNRRGVRESLESLWRGSRHVGGGGGNRFDRGGRWFRQRKTPSYPNRQRAPRMKSRPQRNRMSAFSLDDVLNNVASRLNRRSDLGNLSRSSQSRRIALGRRARARGRRKFLEALVHFFDLTLERLNFSSMRSRRILRLFSHNLSPFSKRRIAYIRDARNMCWGHTITKKGDGLAAAHLLNERYVFVSCIRRASDADSTSRELSS